MRAFSARLIPALVAVTLAPLAVPAQDNKADILPITTARIDQLVKGLEAEYSVWKPAFDRDQKKMQAAEASGGSTASGADARARFDACSGPFVESDTAFQRFSRTFQQKYAGMSQAQMQAIGTRMDGFQRRLDQIGPDGDKAAAAALQDSVRRVMFEITGVPVAEQARTEARLRATVEKACGKEPPRQREQDQSSSEPQPVEGLETDTLVSEAGLRASGLRPRAYTILRERVAAYVLSKTEERELGDYVFTAAEKAALDQRMSALRKYAEMLSSTGHWQFD